LILGDLELFEFAEFSLPLWEIGAFSNTLSQRPRAG
jgi:hypothetical protein